MEQTSPSSKTVSTQSGGVIAHLGRRYHVVVRSHEFGNDEYDGTLQLIQTLDPNPHGKSHLRKFDFLHFVDVSNATGGGKGARDFTIHSLREIA